MKHDAKTAILMVSYNKAKILDICLSAIDKSVDKKLFDVYVIDNGSTEDIKSIAREHNAHYTRNEKNNFVSRALNDEFFDQNISKKYKYAVFMANDVLVDKNTFIEMVTFMESTEKVAITGPVHFEWNSQIPRSRGLTIHPLTSLLVNFMDDKPEHRINHFHSIYLIRCKEFSRVGGFNHTLFPMIFEEPDVGERILALGYEARCTMKANIWHPIEPENTAAEATTVDIRQDRLYSNKPKAYLFFRNRILYMALYSRWWQLLTFIFVLNPLIFFYYLPTIKKRDIIYAVTGVIDGLIFSLTKSSSYIAKRNKRVLDI